MMACVRHGYWLYRAGAGSRLPSAIIPEISRAQRRLARIAARHGTDAAVRAYDIARRYLWEDWRTGGGRPIWYDALSERWYDRADTAASSQSSALPWWAVHPECAALAAMFASPFWAELAVPAADRRHRLFYQHMLAVLGIGNDWTRRTASIRRFGTLPEDIREQAGWGRLLSDPEWGSPIPTHGAPSKIPFIGITDLVEDPAQTVGAFHDRVVRDQHRPVVRQVGLRESREHTLEGFAVKLSPPAGGVDIKGWAPRSLDAYSTATGLARVP